VRIALQISTRRLPTKTTTATTAPRKPDSTRRIITEESIKALDDLGFEGVRKGRQSSSTKLPYPSNVPNERFQQGSWSFIRERLWNNLALFYHV